MCVRRLYYTPLIQLWLDNGHPSLLQGQTDTFVVTSPLLLSPLHTLIVGHNNSGQTPGWFLDKVINCAVHMLGGTDLHSQLWAYIYMYT